MGKIKSPPIELTFDKIHQDARGIISRLPFKGVFRDILHITCTKGALRAQHLHLSDYHVVYLIKGSMNYYERPMGSNEKPKKFKFKAGQWFFTGSKIEHLMEFLENSEFISISRLSRQQQDYLRDTKKLDFDLRSFC